MFEQFGFEETTARQASLYFALGLGLLFGALAQVTRFCFRRAVVGEDRRQAAGVWATALIVAVLGTQAVVASGLVSFDGHRLLTPDLPWLAVIVGGLLFGVGMVLTRGCISRLAVLGGGGNLRGLFVLLVFAVTAHATLKGVLAPLRTGLGQVTVGLGDAASLAAIPGGAWVGAALLSIIALAFVWRSGNRPLTLVGAAAIGLLVPLGWVGTGYVLLDEFDPITMESLSFTAPTADTLFWGIASSAVEPGFGVGLVGGTILGALVAALLAGSFKWQSFESPAQTGRYVAGGVLMGMGGVLAGGCTLGAGLSGLPTLSVAALLALGSMALGARLTDAALRSADARSARPTTPQAQPAE
ncbi:YeeE/YedE family protein [Lutimaribacter marinistellae]|uniref:YeeE/YedE family protein n=1 Tax=Lutimaribacter marinistellae TaxID=1820329 RepID=A0ABV7TKN4_9RHOB